MSDVWSRAWCQTTQIPNFHLKGITPLNEERRPPNYIPRVFSNPTQYGSIYTDSRSPSPEVEESSCFGRRKRARKTRRRSPIVVQRPRMVLEKVPHFKSSVGGPAQPTITRQQSKQSDSSGSCYLTPPVSPGRVRVHKTLSRTPSAASGGPGNDFPASAPVTPFPGARPTGRKDAATRRPSFLETRLAALVQGTLAISQQVAGAAGHTAGRPGFTNSAPHNPQETNEPCGSLLEAPVRNCGWTPSPTPGTAARSPPMPVASSPPPPRPCSYASSVSSLPYTPSPPPISYSNHHCPSPNHHSPSPNHHSPSPNHHSPSPNHHSPSPNHLAPAPNHPTPSPKHLQPSPNHLQVSSNPRALSLSYEPLYPRHQRRPSTEVILKPPRSPLVEIQQLSPARHNRRSGASSTATASSPTAEVSCRPQTLDQSSSTSSFPPKGDSLGNGQGGGGGGIRAVLMGPGGKVPGLVRTPSAGMELSRPSPQVECGATTKIVFLGKDGNVMAESRLAAPGSPPSWRRQPSLDRPNSGGKRDNMMEEISRRLELWRSLDGSPTYPLPPCQTRQPTVPPKTAAQPNGCPPLANGGPVSPMNTTARSSNNFAAVPPTDRGRRPSLVVQRQSSDKSQLGAELDYECDVTAIVHPKVGNGQPVRPRLTRQPRINN